MKYELLGKIKTKGINAFVFFSVSEFRVLPNTYIISRLPLARDTSTKCCL